MLTPADEIHHINKHNFKVPFVCGCRDLGEALRRIAEGAAMIRTKGEAGTGNVVEAVRHARAVMGAIRQLQTMDDDELYVYAKEIRAPVELVRQTKHLGRLPVVNFAAGGVATPADAALMMQLGMDGVFVGSGIFKSGDPSRRARAIVQVRARSNAGLMFIAATLVNCVPRHLQLKLLHRLLFLMHLCYLCIFITYSRHFAMLFLS